MSIGTASCALALLMRAAVQLVWPTSIPLGFLFPMILLATVLGRLLGGLACFALGGALIWFYVRPDLESAGFRDSNGAAVLFLYAIVGGTLLLISESYRRAQGALHREQMLRADAEAERQRLLAQELGHRIKNLLTTVQAIAAQTLDGAGVGQNIRRTFENRLVALARAHELLTDAAWTAVPLQQLITTSTSAFENGHRFNIGGPDIVLPPRQAIAVALALHELATNALKYGALSAPTGQVDINWRQDSGGLRLCWIEQGGPPVEAPIKSGFGTRLLQRNVAAELGGDVILDYARDGLRCEIVAGAPKSP